MKTVRLTALAFLCIASLGAGPGIAEEPAPFASLPGLWAGKGRLGFKDGKDEAVECRATYFVSGDKRELKQTVRCASGGGKVEVKSVITYDAGKLTGTWNETVYNLAGDISGEVTKQGLKISAKGADLHADMEVIVKQAKQIIEIHFDSEVLVGLTLVLDKSSPSAQAP